MVWLLDGAREPSKKLAEVEVDPTDEGDAFATPKEAEISTAEDSEQELDELLDGLSESKVDQVPLAQVSEDGELPSVGSRGHFDRTCSPCGFVLKKHGCHAGEKCLYCHYPHTKSDIMAMKPPRPCKQKRVLYRNLVDFLMQRVEEHADVMDLQKLEVDHVMLQSAIPPSILGNRSLMEKLKRRLKAHVAELAEKGIPPRRPVSTDRLLSDFSAAVESVAPARWEPNFTDHGCEDAGGSAVAFDDSWGWYGMPGEWGMNQGLDSASRGPGKWTQPAWQHASGAAAGSWEEANVEAHAWPPCYPSGQTSGAWLPRGAGATTAASWPATRAYAADRGAVVDWRARATGKQAAGEWPPHGAAVTADTSRRSTGLRSEAEEWWPHDASAAAAGWSQAGKLRGGEAADGRLRLAGASAAGGIPGADLDLGLEAADRWRPRGTGAAEAGEWRATELSGKAAGGWRPHRAGAAAVGEWRGVDLGGAAADDRRPLDAGGVAVDDWRAVKLSGGVAGGSRPHHAGAAPRRASELSGEAAGEWLHRAGLAAAAETASGRASKTADVWQAARLSESWTKLPLPNSALPPAQSSTEPPQEASHLQPSSVAALRSLELFKSLGQATTWGMVSL